MLGIKKKKKKARDVEELVVVDSQFNDVEVDFLKALAYKGTKGASSNGRPLQTSQAPKINTIKKAEINTVKAVAPKPIQQTKPKLKL